MFHYLDFAEKYFETLSALQKFALFTTQCLPNA